MAPFSLATTMCCRGRYSFSRIAPLILDPYLIMLSVNKAAPSNIFGVFGLTRPRIEFRSPGSLANTQPIGQ